MEVSIVGVGGETIVKLKLEDDWRVRDVLSKLRDITGLPTFMQVLMYGSIELGRDDLLKDQAIEASSILTHVALHDVFMLGGFNTCICESAQIYRMSTGTSIQAFWGHDNGVEVVNFSVDGSLVVTGSSDCTAKVWDEANGKCLRTFRHGDAVISCVFSECNDLVLTASHDFTARIWDLSTGECLHSLHVEESVDSAVFYDHEYVLLALPDFCAQLWNVMAGSCVTILPSVDPGRYCYLPAPLLSQDGTTMMGISDRITIWCNRTYTNLDLELQCPQPARQGCLSADGSRVLVACENEISCWMSTDGTLVQRMTVMADGRIQRCALSDDGVLAFVSGPTKHSAIAEVWSTATGERMARLGEIMIDSAAFFTLKKKDREEGV
jgi:WD40 repeat protein